MDIDFQILSTRINRITPTITIASTSFPMVLDVAAAVRVSNAIVVGNLVTA
jgi:hypothetical protein